MRLTSLHVRRLPGIDTRMRLDFSAGVTLIHGPNGVGKSSLCRALWSLWWPAANPGRPFSATAEFRLDHTRLRASREENDPVVWEADDQPFAGPPLPSGHVADSYRLNMLDLLRRDAGPVGAELAQELRRQMAGGYDLDKTAAELFKVGAKAGIRPRKALSQAQARLLVIRNQHIALAEQEGNLAHLTRELAAARLAARRLTQLENLTRRTRRQMDLEVILKEKATYPEGLAQLQPDDSRQLADWRLEEQETAAELAGREARLTELESRRDDLAFPPGQNVDRDLPLVDGLCDRLAALQTRLDITAQTLGGLRAGQMDTPETGEIAPVGPEHFSRLSALHAQLVGLRSRSDQLASLLGEPEYRGPSVKTAWLVRLAGLAAAVLAGPRVLATEGLLIPFLVVCGGILIWTSRRLGAAAALAKQTRETRRNTEEDLARTRRQQTDALAELADLCAETGLTPETVQPDLLHDLKALALRQEADLAVKQTAAELETLRDKTAQALADLNRILARVGFSPALDAATARRLGDDLRERHRRLESLAETLQQEQAARQQAAVMLSRCRTRIGELLDRLGLENVPGADEVVRSHTHRKDDWDRLVAEETIARQDLRRLEADLAPEQLLVDPDQAGQWSLAELAERIAAAETEARGADDLLQEIATIREKIQTARRGDELAVAQAEVAQGIDELGESREAQREAAAGRLLLDHVRRQNEQATRPELLQAAMDLLALFTADRYRLLVDTTEGDVRFRAFDNTAGRSLELEQLSDGTRAQLLLAVRLAFITHAEDGLPLPLFLDDSLTASDPERFDAIAGSLGILAREQERQIIYLTPDPADVMAWQRALSRQGLPAAAEIDLGRLRDREIAAGLDTLTLPGLVQTPSPTGMDAIAYGEILSVPPIGPWRADTELHLFHLLRDNLDLLYRLVDAGTADVGRWRAGGRRLVRAGLVTDDDHRLVDERVKVWRGVLAGWRIGRGRPVTRADLEASGAVSKAMMARVLVVLDQHQGQGPAFMKALMDGEATGLHTGKKNQLRDHLESVGCLDTRPVLDRDGLLAHVLGALAPEIRRGRLPLADVRSLVQQLATGLDRNA